MVVVGLIVIAWVVGKNLWKFVDAKTLYFRFLIHFQQWWSLKQKKKKKFEQSDQTFSYSPGIANLKFVSKILNKKFCFPRSMTSSKIFVITEIRQRSMINHLLSKFISRAKLEFTIFSSRNQISFFLLQMESRKWIKSFLLWNILLLQSFQGSTW